MKKTVTLLSTIILLVFTTFGFASCVDNGQNQPIQNETQIEQPGNSSFSPEQIYSNAKDCVVEIRTRNNNNEPLSIGSGFVYSSDGIIITNYHVIKYASYADVFIGEQNYTVKNVLAYNTDNDVAILKIQASNLKTLPLNANHKQIGSPIFAIGSPQGFTATFSSGIVSYNSRYINGHKYIQHTAPISGGNSGGPLINENCEIIGINTYTYKNSQNLNFALDISELENVQYLDTPMTLFDVTKKEHPLSLLKLYVAKKGKLTENNYIYEFNTNEHGSSYMLYNFITDTVTIGIFFDSFAFSMYLNEGAKKIEYFLATEVETTFYMLIQGYLYPKTFNKETQYLEVIESTITDDTKLKASELSSKLASILITSLNKELSEIPLSAYELGFINF